MMIDGRNLTMEFVFLLCFPVGILGCLLAIVLARRFLSASDPETLASNKVALLFGTATGILSSAMFGVLWLTDLIQSLAQSGSITATSLLAKLASLVGIVTTAIWLALGVTAMTALRLRWWRFDRAQTEAMAAFFDKVSVWFGKGGGRSTRRGRAA